MGNFRANPNEFKMLVSNRFQNNRDSRSLCPEFETPFSIKDDEMNCLFTEIFAEKFVSVEDRSFYINWRKHLLFIFYHRYIPRLRAPTD